MALLGAMVAAAGLLAWMSVPTVEQADIGRSTWSCTACHGGP